MAAKAPAIRHNTAADVVEEPMVTPKRDPDLSQVVGAAGIDVCTPGKKDINRRDAQDDLYEMMKWEEKTMEISASCHKDVPLSVHLIWYRYVSN